MKLCGFEVGLDRPFFLIAGPCVIESMQLQLDTAGKLKEITSKLGVPFIFKSSFDKANRTSGTSFRGPGLEEGLKVLAEVKRQLGVPVLTDVHEYTPMDEVAAVVDVLQTPAFLCRQTDFIQKVASAGKPVNIKKGQFLAPGDMKQVVAKAKAASGADNVMRANHAETDKHPSPDARHQQNDCGHIDNRESRRGAEQERTHSPQCCWKPNECSCRAVPFHSDRRHRTPPTHRR